MQPGESGKIPLSVSTAKLSSRISKQITVYTNIPGEAGTVHVKLSGDVWQAVEVTPRSAQFARLTADEAQQGKSVKLTIVNNVDTPAKITDVRSTNPVFKAEVAEIDPGKKFELTVTAAGTLSTGGNNGSIDLSTGIAEMPTMQVPVSAYLAPDVEVVPAQLVLPQERTADMTRQLSVRNFTKQPLKISDLKASNPALKVSLQETTPGVSFVIKVDAPASYAIPQNGDNITFHTDCPTMALVTVPVMAAPKPPPGGMKPSAVRATTAGPAPAAVGPAAITPRGAPAQAAPPQTGARPSAPPAGATPPAPAAAANRAAEPKPTEQSPAEQKPAEQKPPPAGAGAGGK